ncbi:SRPBCC family protein [Mycolicibacterium palauense]|uniref:SRPBCC family protein n=1 Tax=Mycolicibacterium palauense TaxID=2034511 RepID=UPI000BFEADC7|nr:SRPBCC family protein [Mycolicibacterium palauense]
MARSYVMEQSRAIPVGVDAAYSGTLPIDLRTIMSRWYGPVAPVTSVTGQSGEWANIGQTRTIVQAGGASMREELTRVDPPRGFAYRLTDVTGPLSALVHHIDGQWSFEPVGTGTRVTWRWTVQPKSAAAAAAMPAFAWLWKGFARQGLEELSERLLG